MIPFLFVVGEFVLSFIVEGAKDVPKDIVKDVLKDVAKGQWDQAVEHFTKAHRNELQRGLVEAFTNAVEQLRDQARTDDERAVIQQLKAKARGLFPIGTADYNNIVDALLRGDKDALLRSMSLVVEPYTRFESPELRDDLQRRLHDAFFRSFGSVLQEEPYKRTWIDFQRMTLQFLSSALVNGMSTLDTNTQRRFDEVLKRLRAFESDPAVLARMELAMEDTVSTLVRIQVETQTIKAETQTIEELTRQVEDANRERFGALTRELRRGPLYVEYEGREVAAKVEQIVREHALLVVGRDETLANLDAFVEGDHRYPDAGYDSHAQITTAPARAGALLIESLPGVGKTALLARWVERRRTANEFIAYHFFRQNDLVTQSFTNGLRNLVRQLYVYHELRGQPLPPTEDGLRDAIFGLLQEKGSRPDQTLVIVIDGLDEADVQHSLPLPSTIPAGVFVVVAARTMEGQFLPYVRSWPVNTIRLPPLTPLPRPAIGEWLRQADEGRLASLADDTAFLDQVDDKTQGLALYLHYLVDELVEAATRGVSNTDLRARVEQAPKGFQKYVDEQLNLLAEKLSGQYGVQDLLAVLTVAKGPLQAQDLQALTGLSVFDLRALPWQVTRWLIMDHERSTYAFAHPLLATEFRHAMGDQAQDALRKLIDRCDHWQENRSPYALRHYAQHLALTVGQSKPEQRSVTIERLVRLVADREFQEVHEDVLNEPEALQRDQMQALGLAAVDRGVQTSLVIKAALALVGFRRQKLIPKHLFLALAAEGKLEEAEQRLGLFSFQLDTQWYQAILLTIAWLGFDRAPAKARTLRDRVVAELASAPELDLLRARVAVTMDGASLPDLPLGEVPSPYIAEAMVARLAGQSDESLLDALRRRPGETELMVGRQYLSVTDGPQLVALAVADPVSGNEYLKKYVDIHRMYGYVQYRNRSLWALLGAVLRHPEQEWVRHWVCEVGSTALAPSVEFQEGLGFTVLALQAAAGEQGASQELSALMGKVRTEASELSAIRGRSDSWGAHKRRLAALAEAFSRIPELALDPSPLISTMLAVPYGFAGYEAPACLNLAEAVLIARPNDQVTIERVLDAALTSAHNVQDETLCARTTARVNAMRMGWWGLRMVDLDVAKVVRDLRQDPSMEEFAALHLVDEAYKRRVPDATLVIDRLRRSTTLKELATVYDRTLAEFLRLNPVGGEKRVNVPDPEFAPLLAARFAAQSLVDGSLFTEQRIELIRSLVPVAASNPTALDTVLSRLLLAWRPNDLNLLRELNDDIVRNVAAPVADIALPQLPG